MRAHHNTALQRERDDFLMSIYNKNYVPLPLYPYSFSVKYKNNNFLISYFLIKILRYDLIFSY